MSTFTTYKFNAPIEQLPETAKAPFKPAASSLSRLVGTWQNIDAATQSIGSVVLTNQQGTLEVHVFGACSPTPCDWQQVPGQVYDASVSGGPAIAFTATYNFGFKNTIIAGHHQGPNLIIEDFNVFTDGSGRAAYYDKGTFKRV
jgi:hypothetical protein